MPLPVPPVPAASLVLLRQRDGLEVLVGRRSDRAPAFPGATVFPGGKLDPQDARWPGARDAVSTAAYAALRETFEETGVFVAADGQGPPPGVDVAEARRSVEAGEVSFADLSQDWGRPVGVERLTPFAHWVTPEGPPYRFDTLFFLAEASACEAEAELYWAEFEQLSWRGLDALLSSGAERLMPPTRLSLEPLREVRSPAEALEAARRRGLITRPGAQPFAAR